MCGVIGIAGTPSAAEDAVEGLRLLQHRGQESAGLATLDGNRLSLHKGQGLVTDVFGEFEAPLRGSCAIGHIRYSTSGSKRSNNEIQPLYVSAPFGMVFAHNGNLPDCSGLRKELAGRKRHINSESDTEVILNVFADELDRGAGEKPDCEAVFKAVAAVHRRCSGGYAIVALVSGCGLVAFRDPHGFRPLALGSSCNGSKTVRIVASESAAICGLGHRFERDVCPGEAVVLTPSGDLFVRQCAENSELRPCLFEYVYFARPDSIIDGALVYQTRLEMGRMLARRLRRDYPRLLDVDAVIPVPESSRHCALELAKTLSLPYREGFVKNRYIGRTFIMPDQRRRMLGVRRKLATIQDEFAGKAVLLVDDSIVRGTTAAEIVTIARNAGARKIHFASAAPQIRHPNIYGVDLPSRRELVASERDDEQIAVFLGADSVVFQRLDDLRDAVRSASPRLRNFEASCFDGQYAAGPVDWGEIERQASLRSRSSPVPGLLASG